MEGIELKEFRTLNSKHFLQEDKTIKVQVYKENIHYLENNEYKEIDNSLIKTKKGYKNKANNFLVEFNTIDNCINISNKLKMSLKDSNPLMTDYKISRVKKAKNIENINFQKVLSNIDLDYEIHPNKLKESIIINKKVNIDNITFIINTELKLKLNKDNTISIIENKKEVYKITKPYMFDANNEISENVKYSLKKLTKHYELTITFDKKWANAKARKFPVIIDPTINVEDNVKNLINTFIFNGDENTTTYNLNYLNVGVSGSTIYRSLLKFNLPIIPASYKLVNATLNLFAFPVTSGSNEDIPKISVHRINTDWTEATAKWNNMNDKYNSDLVDYFEAARHIGDNYIEENTANITSALKDWYNNPSNNYGIMLKQEIEREITNFPPIQFASNKYSNNDAKPALVITYKNYNGVTDYFSYSTQQHFFGTSSIANYTGNLTTIFDVANTVGGIFPASLSLVYNTYDISLDHDYGCGLGIKPNLMQFINNTGLENFPLSYTNDTGTVHYFYYDEEEKVYKDEDGLGLKLCLVDSNYILTDKDGNTSKFVARNNSYYLIEVKETNGSAIKVEYDSSNRISKVIDASNKEITITYDTSKITFTSPYKTTEVNLTNNLITSITSLSNTEEITYTTNNLIESIKNPNGIAIKYYYTSDKESKVSRVEEISTTGTVGNYLTFKYNVSDTKVVDRLGVINTYMFNNNGNVVGTTNLDETQDLTNAYGKTYIFGENQNDVNKMTTDKALVKYVDNLISDSSFENRTNPFNSGGINTTFTTDARTGKYAIKFDVFEQCEISYKHKLEKVNRKATFSFYAKGNGKFRIMASGDYITSYHTYTLTNTYQRFQVTVNNTIDNNSILIFFDNFTGSEFIVDDIQLEYGAVANYYNLVDNSSFINGTNSWDITVSGENGSYSVDNISSKKKALKIHSAPSADVSVEKIIETSGKEGDTYNLSFWYKNNGIDATGIGMSMMKGIIWATVFFYYDDEFIDGTCVPITYFNVGNDNWQFFSANFSAQTNYNKIGLRINSFGNANDCWITNFSLFKDIEAYSFSYDENGNLISTIDLNKAKSTMKYNKNNQLLDAMTPMGSNYSFEYDKKIIDRVINSTSPTGINNRIVYDSLNNPIKTIISNRKTNSALEYNIPYFIRAIGTNKYLYINDDKSLKVKDCDCSIEKFNLLLSGNNVKIQNTILNNYYLKARDNNITLEYGDNDNLFAIERNDNNSYTIKYGNNAITINDSNNIVLSPYEENNVNQQFVFEQANFKEVIESSAEYTQDGRFIKSVTDSVDNKTTYDINTTNGLINILTNPDDVSTNYTYDEKLRVKKITKGQQEVNYEYDNNNLSKIIYGTDNYLFNYNEFNRISDIKINDNTLVTNTYLEHNGNLSKVTYGNNNEISYSYDDLDRLSTVKKKYGTYNLYYDNLGRLSKIEIPYSYYLYEYDFADRLSSYNYRWYNLKFDYNKDNNVTMKEESYNNELKYVYNYEYNTESVITKISVNNKNFNYIYDELGRIKENNINGSYKTKYKYLSHGYKTSNIVREVDDNGTIYKYTYDKLGNITEVYKGNTIVNKYTYDEQSQLIQDDNLITNITTKYTYDNYGNILSKKQYTYNTETLTKEDTYTYGDSNWQDLLTKFNDEEITYDEIGNPITIGSKTLSWIDGRSLREYKDGSTKVTYSYNLDGIRTYKQVNDKIINYYLNGMNIVFEDREGSVLYYIYNEDEVLGFVYDGVTYYYHKNILGDVIGILDSNYQEIVTYSYDAYGNILSIVDNSTNNIGEINPFRYRSYYYDVETNLYYLNSRYYNPETGRFLNADGEIGSNEDFISNNLFTYVSNNPIMDIDVTGNGLASAIRALNYGAAKKLLGSIIGYGSVIALTAVTTAYAASTVKRLEETKPKKTQKKEAKKQTIYTLRKNPADDTTVVYVGRTVDFNRRENEHKLNPERSYLTAVKEVEVDASLAPFTEQYYIELYSTLNSGKLGCNRRNEIRMSGPRRDKYNAMFKRTEISPDNLDTLTYVGGDICK